MRKWIAAAFLAALIGPFPLSGALLDANFTQTTFANAGAEITGMAWAPDGSNRLFVTRKTGQFVIVKNGALLPTPFATLSPVYTSSECGLLGLCFDPDFVINGYVYVFVTVSASEQQIIRYTATGDLGINKTILVPALPTQGHNHDGGGIGIGADGKVYWSIGDNGNGTGVNADLISLASKVGRANRDGSVPAGNPFVDGPGGNNDYIWARGFRNPFTLTFQPATGELWVNSVGANYEQIFLVHAGDHAGWIDYENTQPAGYITPKIKYVTGGQDVRPIAGSVRNNNLVTFTTTSTHGFRQGEKILIAGVTDAGFNGSFFILSTPTATTFTVVQAGPNAISAGGSATTQNQGRAVSGGCFYDSTAVPQAYRGNFFYGDFVSGNFMRATVGVANEVTSVDFFATGIENHIDTAVGPDGALYLAAHGGTIYRLGYNYTQQQILATPMTVRISEGATAAVAIRLAIAPPQNVQVNVARTSGDTDINVSAGATLVFTTGNWSVPQIVQIQASPDLDSFNDTATLTASATGLTSESINVSVLDVPSASFSVGLISAGPGAAQVGLTGTPGNTYVLEASTTLAPPWTPLSTNKLNGSSTVLTDVNSINFPTRYYRARLVP